MLFQVRFHEGIQNGSITVTWRAWTSARVKVGGRYHFGLRHQANDYLVVDAVDIVKLSALRAIDARQAGYQSRQELLAVLAKYSTSDTKVYRIKFHYAPDQVDKRVVLRQDLKPENLDAVLHRLRRMDSRCPTGPWTHQILRLIRDQPQVAASRLAPQLGRELLPFKTDVRKLKAMGLTISHKVGYELSARGMAVLERW